MLKYIDEQPDTMNSPSNPLEKILENEAYEKAALIAEIINRVDSLEPDELKLLHLLSLHLKSTETDEK